MSSIKVEPSYAGPPKLFKAIKPDPSTSSNPIGYLNADSSTRGKIRFEPDGDYPPGRRKGDPVYMRREPQRLWPIYRPVDQLGRQVNHDLVELLPGVDVEATMRELDNAARRAGLESERINAVEMEIYRMRLALWNEIESIRKEGGATPSSTPPTSQKSTSTAFNPIPDTRGAAAKRKASVDIPPDEDDQDRFAKRLKRE
ncbi:hypothetical protein GP486_004102 [Trichoglossum hirsutum]|uniref:Uncharacterized protein n=1 Tax=Trichoglossum hirsutum TaxID=265104 RepID=A0A9P8RPP1_9PEZI|nr:hypothetical protein GP486_004102 [Trichoglossum hirsutum]